MQDVLETLVVEDTQNEGLGVFDYFTGWGSPIPAAVSFTQQPPVNQWIQYGLQQGWLQNYAQSPGQIYWAHNGQQWVRIYAQTAINYVQKKYLQNANVPAVQSAPTNVTSPGQYVCDVLGCRYVDASGNTIVNPTAQPSQQYAQYGYEYVCDVRGCQYQPRLAPVQQYVNPYSQPNCVTPAGLPCALAGIDEDFEGLGELGKLRRGLRQQTQRKTRGGCWQTPSGDTICT